jgi:uncharacterized protein (DUF2141 family)
MLALLFLPIQGGVAVGQEGVPTERACPVTIVAQGVRGSQGTIGFVVYSSKEGWPNKYEKAFLQKATAATPGDVSVTVEIPPGRYAVALLHDENGNKRLDRKPSGRPREGFGISNNPKVALKTPSFAAAAVDIPCGDRVLIRVRYPSKTKDNDQ